MRQRKPKVELIAHRRKTLSIALAMSIASASAFAQTDLPALPELPQLPAAPSAQLPHPYPFANPEIGPTRSVSARVVGLLGFCKSAAQSPMVAHTQEPCIQEQMQTGPELLHTRSDGQLAMVGVELPSTGSSVVMAAAVQSGLGDTAGNTVQLSDTINLTPIAADRQPSQIPEHSNERELPASGGLTSSLIDIDIPLENSSKPATSLPKVPTVLVTEASLPELPAATTETTKSRAPSIHRPQSGLELSLEPLQSKAGLPVAAQPSRSSRSGVELVSNVSGASAASKGSEVYNLSDDSENSFKLSDSEDSKIPGKPNRPVVHEPQNSLHLSSASSAQKLTVPKPEPRPMQIQIEGVPSVSGQLVSNKLKENASTLDFSPSEDRPAPKSQQVDTAKLIKNNASAPSVSKNEKQSSISMAPIMPGEMQQGPNLRVGIQDAMLVQSDVPILELSVENPEVCQLIQTGSQSYSLLGLQAGSTRIALVSMKSSGDRSVEIREVTVATAGVSNSSGLEGLAQGITASLEQLYPQYAIDIDVVDRSLLVQGEVGSELEAKRIITLIRKASLTPVIDRLKSEEQ